MLERLRARRDPWDVVIIGGGATGLGCAVDAAARGLSTVLVEGGDFAHATSSRSTKLFHGGVRYLRGGQVALVAQSLRERAALRRNAPALIQPLNFIVPCYRPGERLTYGTGLALYAWLARRGGDAGARSHSLSRAETLARAPTLRAEHLRGSAMYGDDQFDDARFALALARTAASHDAVLLNHARVTSLLARGGRVAGVVAVDKESGADMEIAAHVVVNATGVHADNVRRLDDAGSRPLLRTSRGAHITLDRSFFPGNDAVLIPRTDDGRVVFLIPWRGVLLVGTTDTPEANPLAEPLATRDDVAFLLEHAARYLSSAPQVNDVRSAFAGLRPLLDGSGTSTATLRREHRILVSPRGLVTVTGGKWTTYRLMAEETVTRACASAGLATAPSRTTSLAIAGGLEADSAIERAALARDGNLTGVTEETVRAARESMARCVEDVLARRTRALFLDARGAALLAPTVAGALARELGRDAEWAERDAAAFTVLARRYDPASG